MPEKQNAPSTTAPPPAPPKRIVNKFLAPTDLDARFNAFVDTNNEAEGIVPTEDVRALLDAFGLRAKAVGPFPMQVIERVSDQFLTLRIDDEKLHITDDVNMRGHRWVFRRQERSSY